MASIYRDVYFHLSTDLDLDVKVHVGSLELAQLPCIQGASREDLFLTIRLMDGGQPLHPCVRASRLPVEKDGAVHWDEWLALPIKIRDLPRTAQLIVELWDVGPRLVGGTTVRMFDQRLRLKSGLQKLTLWPTVVDASSPDDGASPCAGEEATRVVELIRNDPDHELLKAVEKYELGDASMPPSPWTDRLAFAQIRRELRAAASLGSDAQNSPGVSAWTPTATDEPTPLPARTDAPHSGTAAAETPRKLEDREGEEEAGDPVVTAPYLFLTFPAFQHTVVYEDAFYSSATPDAPPLVFPSPGAAGTGGRRDAPSRLGVSSAALAGSSSTSSRGGMGGVGAAAAGGAIADAGAPGGGGVASVPYWYEGGILSLVRDPEAEAEADNPVEAKYHRLARGLLRGAAVDPNLKPNRGELSRIQEALAAPSLSIDLKSSLASRDVGDLLWKFRYSLTGNRKALTKFLMCVDWDVEEDVKEAVGLLARWAPIDTEDALRLLSSDFPSLPVREHAVSALQRASDDDLVLFLLQLVQALRYEPDLLALCGVAPLPPKAGAGPGAGGKANAAPSPPAPAPAAAAAAAAAPVSTSGGTSPHVLSPLADFLIDRACASLEVANFLHWYLTVERGDARMGTVFTRVHEGLMSALNCSAPGRAIAEALAAQADFLARLAAACSAATSNKKDSVAAKIEKLNSMMAPGGAHGELCALPELVAMPLNPLILTSGVVPRGCIIFKSALYPTVITTAVHPSSRVAWDVGGASCAGLKVPEEVMDACKAAKVEWAAGVEARRHRAQLQAAAAAGGHTGQHHHHHHHHHTPRREPPSTGAAAKPAARRGWGAAVSKSGGGLIAGFMHRSGAPAPTDEPAPAEAEGEELEGGAAAGGEPEESGSSEDEATALSTAAAEAAANLGSHAATYRVIFKNGDDMRQDQLVIQMIRLMDQQLKRVGLDLRLTPYRVLAMSSNSGVMEMVLSSMPVSAVLATYKGDIMSFFRAQHPREDAEYGIEPEVMDTYVKSSAGYSVITYLLGIGDRHLDNIMLATDGRLFHLDFGYIAGRDPKPFPAPIRLTREMIDGLGGPSSNNYARFVRYSCQAFNVVRKSANLLLSLLSLMVDAGIEDLSEQPGGPTVVIAKLQDRFRLDLDDEAAESYFLKLVEESTAAFFPAFFEYVHRVRVAFR